MKLTKKLLILAAFLLALPLVFTGYANAGYTGDGATHDGTTTGWKIPPIEAGVNGCLVDGTKTSRPDCNTVRFPAYTDGTACSASAEFIANKRVEWASGCSTAAGSGIAISLSGLTRNALECNKLGGVYEKVCQGAWIDVKDTSGGTTYQCLRCHNNTYQRNSPSYRWKSSTLSHGHKNMLRKVTAGQPWAGPDGVVYGASSVGSGTTINWTTAMITGTSFTGSRQMYYIYGDWMAPAPSVVYDSTAAGSAGYAKYSCASCHTTGYVATNFMVGKEPNNTYPTLGSGITGSWDVDGIVCSRCHNVAAEGTTFSDPYRASLAWGSDTTSFTTHETDNFGVPYGTDGALMTALCIECHNSTQTKTDPAGQLKTAASGTGFSGHILGNQFLNSTHGKFTGTSGQVGTEANYASTFSGGRCTITKTGVASNVFVEAGSEAKCAAAAATYGTTDVTYTWTAGYYGGSCSTCHDVHQSIVPEVGAAEPLRRECTDCHTAVSVIAHPETAGTPVGLGGSTSVACEICHMATESPEGSTHLPVHLWRINTDATYRTFPTGAEWSAGTKIANTAPDGTYANAVWVDLDLACGQCHGASAGATATTNGAPYMSKDTLAISANGMHTALTPPPPLADPTTTADPIAGGTLSVGTTVCTDPGTGVETCNIGAPGSVNFGTGTSSGTLTIWWGDGSGLQTPPDASHTYTHVGRYQVIVTATNAAGERTQQVFIVMATGAGSGKGTLAITGNASAAPFSYSVENPSDGVSITNGKVNDLQTRNIQLDAGSYDVVIGLRSGVVPGSASGTCTNYPTTQCYVDLDCPVTDFSTTPYTHDICAGGATALTGCTAAVSSGSCGAQVGQTITCTAVGVTADNTVLTPATVTVSCP